MAGTSLQRGGPPAFAMPNPGYEPSERQPLSRWCTPRAGRSGMNSRLPRFLTQHVPTRPSDWRPKHFRPHRIAPNGSHATVPGQSTRPGRTFEPRHLGACNALPLAWREAQETGRDGRTERQLRVLRSANAGPRESRSESARADMSESHPACRNSDARHSMIRFDWPGMARNQVQPQPDRCQAPRQDPPLLAEAGVVRAGPLVRFAVIRAGAGAKRDDRIPRVNWLVRRPGPNFNLAALPVVD